MGFGKFLAGAACAVGAVIAAPVVLPALATTAGAVGSAVGGAASAVGITSIAAVTATEAGAAAVGTIATSAVVGVSTGVSGTKKLSQANDIKDDAIYRYNKEREEFDKTEKMTNKSLENLGEIKMNIWNSFNRFISMFEKIHNKPELCGKASSESIKKLTKDELKNIKGVALTVQDMLKGGTGAIVSGGLIGIATSGGLVSTITVASTGTAMTTLSGAAATNATLAALGGGSLASQGLGMAGGATVLGGLTFAPMVAVGGIMLNSKGNSSLNTAYDISNKSDEAINKMIEGEKLLDKVKKLSDDITMELIKLNKKYLVLLNSMEQLVQVKINYIDFTKEEKNILEKMVLSVKLLKELSMTSILDSKNNNMVLEGSVRNRIEEVAMQRETELAW
ncbi:TPA: hypothetical protein PTV43_003986 [Clostridium botulinum]|nr:hypothetical protein [Clostridium botulinum]HDK7158745.1 hypothetical protein [Clostridium botulinum]